MTFSHEEAAKSEWAVIEENKVCNFDNNYGEHQSNEYGKFID